MTKTMFCFVRHAESDHGTGNDVTRPLTQKGMADRMKAVETVREFSADLFFSSPYQRAIDTISPAAITAIQLDDSLRERKTGKYDGEFTDFVAAQWNDFSWHGENGESLGDVERRMCSFVDRCLESHAGMKITAGTHGTALSVLVHHYDPSFGKKEYLEVMDLMPWLVWMTFEGRECTLIETQDVFSKRKKVRLHRNAL